MNEKITVITGCSSGFGLLISIELAKSGYHVIATMRDLRKQDLLLHEAKMNGVESSITVHELDVTSQTSINNLKAYIEKIGRIDVLINNAGFAGAGFVEEIPIAEYRKQFETNFFGVIAVTQAFLPLMRAQQNGLIINMSSISGRMGFPGMSPYVSSKHALEGWSECLRLEMQPFGIHVALIEPGSFKTNIWSSGKHITDQSMQKESPYFHYMKQIEQYIEKGEPKFGDPIKVAKKVAKIASQSNPSLRVPIGKGVSINLFFKNFFQWKLWERLFLKILYK
ncbi:oxidoreductase [Cytobacillus dafuensis]|uniref:SDR family oxidoreductase n=1 Tax=Cytobacillus dafuensis TaxID=1742359 RepID=A0A5B8Z6T4_CYTDA|nr:oxidoreductase [Cytobacillus dafuensis]QED47893.1 SDR family oxidoreductase [Cytobacillus dafuensis]